jgi:hypothetical protein
LRTSPPGTEGGSDEESEHEDTINRQEVVVLLNRWNDVYIEGHSKLVDMVKVEIFARHDGTKTLLPPMLLIISGERRREITALEVYQCYRRRFDIEHFFRFAKQKLLFCAYQTPDLDHQISCGGFVAWLIGCFITCVIFVAPLGWFCLSGRMSSPKPTHLT